MPKRNRLSRPSKRSFAEKFYPARPTRVLAKARTLAKKQLAVPKIRGAATASNTGYIKWLKNESMLAQANHLARKYSGKSQLWQNPYAKPRPRAAVNMASVWYTAYPMSLITRDDRSILSEMGDEKLWQAFEEIGIKGLHTGPVKQAGGIKGWDATPSIDGHFDRINHRIDRLMGTEEEFKKMCNIADKHGGIIIDDIVPGHTGKGADFRLAEMSYEDYPGIYHMVEIDKADWHLLPDIPEGRGSVNIDADTEEQLKKKEYIIGKLQRVIFYEPDVKETNWSVTRPVKGVDGVMRRWVYLHYFKAGQPSINWLDPSFAGVKLIVGDALHSLGDLGTKALRLDANGFLGIEKVSEDEPAWSEGHPLSETANQLISGMVRKFGGFTFQELNLSIDDIKTMSEDGADLSYDFITRPAYQHALATGDTEFLKLMLRQSLRHGVDPASLIHALQNHDELTYELVHFWTIHKDDEFKYHGKTVKGLELRQIIREDLTRTLTGSQAPYNLLFADNGIACTTATVIAATLGYSDFLLLNKEAAATIKKVHLLLVMFNAWQPGVFALSGWDLSGALTLDPDEVADLIKEGDTRWINRGSYDLMNVNAGASHSPSGMPRATSLYGSLPEQLRQPDSFANQLKDILRVREQYGIAVSHQVDIADTSHKGVLAMLHRLTRDSDDGVLQLTVLNFSGEEIKKCTISSPHLPVGYTVQDVMDENYPPTTINKKHRLNVSLSAYQGKSLLITR